MMRSLYSAISGLKNHQVKMDVIGNNIANVNTTGFKRSRVTFATTLSQTLKGASTPSTTLGGSNPMQIGMGSMLGSIDQIMTQGSTQSTGKATDMLVQGSGFFVLDNNGTVYSRSGAFTLDEVGNLTDPGTGAKVKGVMFAAPPVSPTIIPATPLVPIIIKIGSGLYNAAAAAGGPALDSYSIDQRGVITGVYITPAIAAVPATVGPPPTLAIPAVPATSQTAQIGQIAVATFSNDSGLENIGNSFYRDTNNSGQPTVGEAGSTGHGTIVPGAVEMSNVDLSQEFTDMIVAQRGFQANGRVITVSDTLLQELIDLKRN
ncbi:MAG TPA: flagellar hook-basal body complex protein [Desulfosporosinus sp.]